MTGRGLRCLASAVALLGLVGCQAPDGAVLAPDAAVAACTGPVTLALRASDPDLASVDLAPAAASRIERRQAAVGRQPVAVVVAGGGAAGTAGVTRPVRYLCLLDPRGRAVFVDVAAGDDAAAYAGCPGSVPARRACLADHLRAAEWALADEEAAALKRGGSMRSAARSALEEPLATSIGAWRIYRDAECARRTQAAPAESAELATACRVGLTRARVAELAGA